MAKKSCKRPARLKNDNAGCMWGLLGIFDFRQGRRLLSDKRLGSATRQGGTVHSKNKFDALSNLEGMHEDVSDAVDVERINSSKASNKIPSSIVEQRVEMCIGADIEKNQIKTNKNSKPSPSSRSDRSEISSFDVNLLNLVVEFCGENHEKLIESNGDRKDMHDNLQLNQNHYVLHKDLGDMIEALLARKSFDSKRVTTNGCFEAIDGLNLKKDILQKLLQDPDSLLFKHVQDLQNARSHEIFQHNRSDLKRIVVLKPSTYTISPISSSPELLHDLRHQEGTDKVSFHFSIKGIKRRMRSMVAKLKAEPQLLRFEEEEYNDSQLVVPTPTKLQYVRSVLEASGLDYNKHPERWQSSDQLLDDPFVYDEVEILYGHLLIDGSKLVFDCINEVLVEMKERYTPWISFIKPNIRPLPTGENFVHQVCKGVDKHLQIVVPYTLDGVIRKELECGTFWMNVWMESECAVAEIGEVILEYIMEETILELWE